MAGEILAIGDAVRGWVVGDKVCANFSLDHIHGDPTDQTKLSGLSAPIDGVLTEYKILPAHVRSIHCTSAMHVLRLTYAQSRVL